MVDALWSHVVEHGPTWLIVALMISVQTWRSFRWLEGKFGHVDSRLDDHERVLIDGGYADVGEKTDGGRRLIAVHANRRFRNGGDHG